MGNKKHSSIKSDRTEGLVFDIQRCSMHDGPGIRTTVFLKGCPLDCFWCHNPESIAPFPELSYALDRCIGCGNCIDACPHECHSLKNGMHVFDRDSCQRCFDCTRTCYTGALKKIGRRLNVEDIMSEVLKDKIYYIGSGGGLTVSGGEPMLQPGFTLSLLEAAKKHGIHTCLETCGFTDTDSLLRVRQSVDIFLYDIKETDPRKHKEYTGVSNEKIIENLKTLGRSGSEIILRCPIIPGINDTEEHFKGISRIASQLKNLIEIDIMSYIPYGKIKGIRVGKGPELDVADTPEKDTVESWIHDVSRLTDIPVRTG